MLISHLTTQVDQHLPLTLKQRLLEPRLNRLFATPLQEGEFELLDGRKLQLKLMDLGLQATLTLENQRLRLVSGEGEACIRGCWPAFVRLALKKEDPDSLFFQRQLILEGDTELGLGIKNLLDSLDWSLDQGLEGRLLHWLEKRL